MTSTSPEDVSPSLVRVARRLVRPIVMAVVVAAILLAVAMTAAHAGTPSPTVRVGKDAGATIAQGPPASFEVLAHMHCPAFAPR